MGKPSHNATYASLGFLALLILNRLRTKLELSELAEKQEEQHERDTEGGSADNAGNRYTGANRLGATINLNNAAGLGDIASLRTLTSGSGLNYARA